MFFVLAGLILHVIAKRIWEQYPFLQLAPWAKISIPCRLTRASDFLHWDLVSTLSSCRPLLCPVAGSSQTYSPQELGNTVHRVLWWEHKNYLLLSLHDPLAPSTNDPHSIWFRDQSTLGLSDNYWDRWVTETLPLWNNPFILLIGVASVWNASLSTGDRVDAQALVFVLFWIVNRYDVR